MKKFKVGETYSTRSACNHESVFSYTVIKRTAKMITIRDKFGTEKRKGVTPGYDGEGEICHPEGRYSMCPVIRA